MNLNPYEVALVLRCEGMGDCLFAIPVLKKLRKNSEPGTKLVLFTHHESLFAACPYLDGVRRIDDPSVAFYGRIATLFDAPFPHWAIDTIDYISLPLGLGALSFREKQLEYFPQEEDRSERYDVVLNTSATWPSRTWALENWQRLADRLVASGYSVAVVGKDVQSRADNMVKKSLPLGGCVDLTNQLSLDQTYYTIRRAGLFVTCQNGLSVLGGATDTELVILDMSIEWSKRPIYRHEDPHYKVTYVKGDCDIYCCQSYTCDVHGRFLCIPPFERVLAVVERQLACRDGASVSGRRLPFFRPQ
jgi:ADP-heptose:LPS heptosyltransferase